jgi:hypothetical protein
MDDNHMRPLNVLNLTVCCVDLVQTQHPLKGSYPRLCWRNNGFYLGGEQRVAIDTSRVLLCNFSGISIPPQTLDTG